jgi:uncharacterized protein
VRPSVSIITVASDDVAAARRFYVDGLGWEPRFEQEDEVLFIQVGHGLLVSFWRAAAFIEDAGVPPIADGSPRVSLAHNVDGEDEVRAVLAAAEAAGGTIVKPAAMAIYGGLQGYFADPDGVLWEVAHNPGLTVAADGAVSLAAP